MEKRRDLYPSHVKVLWSKSAGICAVCKDRVLFELISGLEKPIGEAAHICGDKPDSARYDESLPDEFVRSYKNHLLLCPNCHTKIDKSEEDYSVEKLIKIREDHYKWVVQELSSVVSDVNFPELAGIIDYLLEVESSAVLSEDLVLTNLKDKIKKNSLSTEVEQWISLGLTKANLIEKYFNTHPDIKLEERFRKKFVTLYKDTKADLDTQGDELFYQMVTTSTSYQYSNLKKTAAGVALVTYFFERCDIFEK